MLSQKLQDDLMSAYQKVYEEKRGHAAGADDAEKQASQLASDVSYKAKSKDPQAATIEEKIKNVYTIPDYKKLKVKKINGKNFVNISEFKAHIAVVIEYQK